MQHFELICAEPILCIHRVHSILFMESESTMVCFHEAAREAIIGWLRAHHIAYTCNSSAIELTDTDRYWFKQDSYDAMAEEFYLMDGRDDFRFFNPFLEFALGNNIMEDSNENHPVCQEEDEPIIWDGTSFLV